MADSMTQILSSGPPGTKVNIAVLGDGFAVGDQDTYNNKVNDLLLNGVFKHDYYFEDISGFNIFRVNLISVDSGVSTKTYDEHGTPADPSDDTVISQTTRNTALGYIFSGSWAHCWLEGGPNTSTLVSNALAKWVPDYQLCLILLNNPGFGGCGGGGFAVLPMGVDWTTVAHEFGHGYGGLGDEYCAARAYSGGEPGVPNDTINTNRATLKWGNFVNPATPVPTGSGSCVGYNQGTKPADWDDNKSVGLFEGGGTNNTGMYRPALSCRMISNAPPYCTVCYTAIKRKSDPKTARTFLDAHLGDFDGDGKDDLLVHNGNSLMLYRSLGNAFDVAFSCVDRVPGSWQFQAHDQFFIGDFDGDHQMEVVVFNGQDWVMPYLGLLDSDGQGGLHLVARYDGSMPGWQFTAGDQFFVGDFDGDGKADLYVFNGHNWSMPYVGMLRSNGSSLSLVHRYDATMPGWQMKPGDQHFVGDFNGDGKADLWVFNGGEWSIPYLTCMLSQGTSLTQAHRWDSTMPDWQMKPGDQHFIGDFDGDGKTDLYVFNGSDWSMAYLGMLKSDGANLAMVHRYDGNAPGWQMRKNDQHWVADVNGDGKADLFVYNWQDWSTQYLGTMISNGSSLSASWVADWVGEWNLGGVDRFEPCNYEGVAGRRDLVVHNQDWLGLIHAAPGLSLQKIYYRFIHNYPYGRNW